MVSYEKFLKDSRPPRFSLLTLLLLTTIAALGVAVWRVGSEVVPLREEVKRLRDEAGYLVVDADHRDRLQAIEVPQYDDKTWKWKVYLPPGRDYQLISKWNDIPNEGLPDYRITQKYTVDSIPLSANEPREMTLVFVLRKSADGEKWEYRNVMNSSSLTNATRGSMMPNVAQEWLDNPPSSFARGGVFNKHKISKTPSSLVLLRERYSEELPAGSSQVPQIPDGPARGMMLWIEEVKDK